MLRYTHLAIAITLIFVMGTLNFFGHLEHLNHQIFDTSHRFFKKKDIKDIIVVEIDEQSLSALGAWPWPRSYHASLTNTLHTSGASSIVFDLLFSETNARLQEGDQLFAQQISNANTVFLPVAIQAVRTSGPLIEVTPTPLLYQASNKLGHAHIHCNDDGICRSVYLEEGLGNKLWPHITWAVYQDQNKLAQAPGVRDASGEPKQDHIISKNFHNYVPFQYRPEHFQRISYVDALDGIFPKSAFEGKTVFVGVTAAGLGDQITTPSGLIPGVYFHAITFQALQTQSLISYFPRHINTLIFVVISILSIALLVRLSPLNFLIASIGFVFFAYILMIIHLKFMRIWIPIADYMLVIGCFYPVWSWFKLQIALQFLKKRLGVLSSRNRGLFSLAHTPDNLPEKDVYNVDIVTKTLKRLEQASLTLDHQQGFIQHTLAQLSEAVVLTDHEGHIILSNPTAEKLLDIENIDQIQEMDSFLLPKNHHINSWAKVIDNLISDENFTSLELTKHTQTINLDLDLYCQAHKTQLTSGNSQTPVTLLFTFTDITPLKQAEQARLDTLNFLSHDLRSPMVSILALIENVSSGKNIAKTSEILEKIKSYTEKNLGYSENLLLLSKADSIDRDRFCELDIHSIVDSAYYYVSEIASAKNIGLSIHRTNQDCMTLGDASLIERVVINLLSNALKYCPEKTNILLTTEISEDNQIIIKVEDNGPGIEPEALNSLFDRFRGNTQKKRVFGTGLGLYFVKKVIEKHNGEVKAESELGKGSSFSVYLERISS